MYTNITGICYVKEIQCIQTLLTIYDTHQYVLINFLMKKYMVL